MTQTGRVVGENPTLPPILIGKINCDVSIFLITSVAETREYIIF